MTSKKKLHSIPLVLIAVVFAFLVSNSSVALAAQETRLSEDIGENGKPAIYGDKVVWAYGDKIHLYDLKTGNDTTITMPEYYYAASPAIYDNKIVCCRYNVNENPVRARIYVYDIPTSTSSLITENVSYCAPDIYGDRIVWAWERNYKTYIYMYDISTQMQTQITTSGSARNPAIYENKIVWEDYGRNGTAIDKNNNSLSRSDIYMYDLSTKKETRISTSGRASNPAIYGDRIVWQDSRNLDFIIGMGDIYTYNLSTEKESRISYSEQSSPSSHPSIYGDRIVWEDHRKGSNIYMYNLSTQKETQITTSGGAMDPDIYGDIIVDRDNREGLPPGDGYFCDIYMYDLTVKPIKPQASFISNVTSGNTPLAVLFTDTSTGGAPTSWYWDFGDGINSKHAMNATHTFTKPGNYTIGLTVENAAGNSTATKPGYIVVTDPNDPVANFSSNVTEGYAPLSVQFNDLSQNATSRTWDFNNDGQLDSSEINPVYVYRVPGIYTVNLTAGNGNGTTSKTATINVYEYGSSSGSSSRSSGGSSHSSNGGSGGGAGSSPEPQSNVQVKEISQAYVTNGKPVEFDFTKNATCVVYASFDAKKTAGKTTAIAEQLKGKSTLVSVLDSGEVYKYFNIWVGTGGFATSKNMGNPAVCFKVEKSWVQDKKIDQNSITLNRYSDKKWSQLPVKCLNEDNKYLYFTAQTPEFSFFAITGKAIEKEKVAETKPSTSTSEPEQNSTTVSETGQETGKGEATSIPGFEIVCGIVCLIMVFLYKRR